MRTDRRARRELRPASPPPAVPGRARRRPTATTRSRVDSETSNRIVTERSRLRRVMVRKTRSSGMSSARSAIAASKAASRSSSGPSLRRFSRSCRPTLAPRTRRRIRARTAGISVERRIDRASIALPYRARRGPWSSPAVRLRHRNPTRDKWRATGPRSSGRRSRARPTASASALLPRGGDRVCRLRRAARSAPRRPSARQRRPAAALGRRNPIDQGRRRDRPVRPHRCGR